MVVVEADVSIQMLCFSLALASARAAWSVFLYQYGEDWRASALGGPCRGPMFTLLLRGGHRHGVCVDARATCFCNSVANWCPCGCGACSPAFADELPFVLFLSAPVTDASTDSHAILVDSFRQTG